MKKFIISSIAVLAGLFSVAAFADAPSASLYGNVWSTFTQDHMSFNQATIGAKASLGQAIAPAGGPVTGAVSYDAANNALYDAYAKFSLAVPGDSMSIGLQGDAYDTILDSQLGQSALTCFSCTHVKSAIYGLSGSLGSFSLEANENNNYSAQGVVGLLPGVRVAGSAIYDHPSNTWSGKGALLGSYSVLSGVLYGSDEAGVWDYGVEGTVALNAFCPGAGVFGKYAKGGALAVGPTYQVSSGLQLAVLAMQDTAGADFHGAAALSANF